MQTSMMQTHGNLPIDERNSPLELRKRILKLRWIGEETEAERLCVLLSQTAQDHIVIDEPLLTD